MENAKQDVMRRHWFQFRLRTLLVALTLVALGLGYHAHRVRRQQQAVTALQKLGSERVGIVYSSSSQDWPAPLRGLRAWLGEDWFAHVQAVQLTEIADEELTPLTQLEGLEVVDMESGQLTDSGVQKLAQLPSVRMISLAAPQVTDVGAGYLNACQQLTFLGLVETQVTAKGMQKLRMVLPHCRVSVTPDHFSQ